MNSDKSNARRLLGILLIAILFYILLTNLGTVFGFLRSALSLLTPFLIGACFAFLLNIPLRFLEKHLFGKTTNKMLLRRKRPLCLILSVLLFLSAIALLLMLILPRFFQALSSFFTELPGYMEALDNKLADLLSPFPMLAKWKESFTVDWETVSRAVLEWLNAEGKTSVPAMAIDTVKSLLNVLLGFVFALYVLGTKERLSRQIRDLMRAALTQEQVDRILSLCELTSQAFYRFVMGQCTEAVILGLLCFAGMLLLGIPYAIIVSCLIAVTALIPIFGALIGTAVGACIILLASPIKALWFLLFIFMLQQLETHLIYPKVVGKSVGLPGIWVLVSVTLGGEIGGVVGMLIAVPFASVLYSLLRQWVYKRKNAP